MTEISPTTPLPRKGGDLAPPPPEVSFFGDTSSVAKTQEKRWAIMDRLRRVHRREKREERRREHARMKRFRGSYITMAHVVIGFIANFERDPVRRAERRAKLERRMRVAPGSARITTTYSS